MMDHHRHQHDQHHHQEASIGGFSTGEEEGVAGAAYDLLDLETVHLGASQELGLFDVWRRGQPRIPFGRFQFEVVVVELSGAHAQRAPSAVAPQISIRGTLHRPHERVVLPFAPFVFHPLLRPILSDINKAKKNDHITQKFTS